MPIIFITRDIPFYEKIQSHKFESRNELIEKWTPRRKTYYVSPANSLCFMDGGIDYSLSRNIMPGVEPKVKQMLNIYGKTTLLGRKYLPIGSSFIFDYDDTKSLIIAPTMLLPQDISNTQNVYFATMAIMHNLLVNRQENLDNIDVLFTSFGCGFGKMSADKSIHQIMCGLENFHDYVPEYINKDVLICEPNLSQQPKYYQNSEWFNIPANEITRC